MENTSPGTNRDPRPRVLILDILPMLSDLVPPESMVTEARFADLDATLLNRLNPDRVLFPLLSRQYDAIQVIERLQALDYQGAITVIAPSLPHPDMVERELRGLGPGARLVLMTP